MSLIEKFTFKKRVHVGVAVSGNNTIELVYIDKSSKVVERYAAGELQYNSAIREIIDYEELTQVLLNLFEEAGLEMQECCVSLCIPNVHFGISSMDNNNDQAYVLDNLQGELEDLYIFKRNEPVLSYDYVPSPLSKTSKNVAYAAVQGKAVMKIIEVFDKLGIEIERIDNSYISLLRGLRFCDKFNTMLTPEHKTGILIIGANSFCSLAVSGDAIIECKESPLAIKSYSSEEVYAMVSNYATEAIEQNSPDSLIIISETDDINTQLLTEKIEFSGEIEYVNRNAASDEELLDYNRIDIDAETSMISYLSLEAIGAGVSSNDAYLTNINFLPQERINKNIIEIAGYEIEWTWFFIEVLLIALLLGLILGGLIMLLLNHQREELESQNAKKSTEIKLKEQSIQQKSTNSSQREIVPIIKQTLDNNKFILQTYIGLSTEIPENMYIKRFVTNANGGIGVTGESMTSEAVEAFVNRLKEKNTTLMVSRLSVNSTADINCRMPNGFTFAIKTSNADIDLEDNTDAVQGALQGMTGGMQTILPDGSSSNPPLVAPGIPQPVNVTPGQSDSMTPPPPPVI